MDRYCLEVFSDNLLIFYMEFSSITSVAKTIDRFFNIEKLDIWFNLTDTVKNCTIDTKELVRVWHA